MRKFDEGTNIEELGQELNEYNSEVPVVPEVILLAGISSVSGAVMTLLIMTQFSHLCLLILYSTITFIIGICCNHIYSKVAD